MLQYSRLLVVLGPLFWVYGVSGLYMDCRVRALGTLRQAKKAHESCPRTMARCSSLYWGSFLGTLYVTSPIFEKITDLQKGPEFRELPMSFCTGSMHGMLCRWGGA